MAGWRDADFALEEVARLPWGRDEIDGSTHHRYEMGGISHQAATRLSFTGAFPLSVVAMFCVHIRIEIQGEAKPKWVT